MDEQQLVENIEQPPEILEKPPDIPEIPEAPVVNRGGRPRGSKDTVKRVVKPRKITIVEQPLHVEAPVEAQTVAVAAAPIDPVVMKAPKPRAVAIAPEPEIRYVDRYIEHSPRSSMRIAHGHFANVHKSKFEARREHMANVYTGRLR